MTRQKEIRRLLNMSPARMLEQAGTKLLVCPDIDELHQHFARSIAAEIKTNNTKGKSTKLILPVGPVGQYPMLAEIVNSERISLKQCWFFMMDEHCDDNGIVLPPDHPLSFRHTFDEQFASRVQRSLMLPAKQLIFPDHGASESDNSMFRDKIFNRCDNLWMNLSGLNKIIIGSSTYHKKRSHPGFPFFEFLQMMTFTTDLRNI